MCFEENSAKLQPNWDPAVQVRAQELLSQWTLGKQAITSLGFKLALRAMMGPDYEINQTDTSNFLRQWFFGSGGNQIYDTNRTGVFITYAPKLTEDQKVLDAATEKQAGIGQKSGEPMAIGDPLTGVIEERKK